MDYDIYRVVDDYFSQALLHGRLRWARLVQPRCGSDDLPVSPVVFTQARDEAQNAIATIVSKYARLVNDVAPVNQFPVEILSRIFAQLDTTNRVSCTQVCHYWRSAALESPLLWQELHIVVPSPPSQLSPSLATLFARSHQQPVAVHFDFPFETTIQLAAAYARELAQHLPRVSDMRLACSRARHIDAPKSIISLLGDLPSSYLRSIEFDLDIDRSVPDPVIQIPVLDHLPSLEVLSVSGDLEWNLSGLIHRLKILRLPDSSLQLDEPEVDALVNAIIKGTTLEQLEIGGSDLYHALNTWIFTHDNGSGTWPVQSDGRLRYVRWPEKAMQGAVDFANLCALVRARSMQPMTMVMDVHRQQNSRVQMLLKESENYLAQLHLARRAAFSDTRQADEHTVLVIPQSSNGDLVHVSIIASNEERWILTGCDLEVFGGIDIPSSSVFRWVTSLAAHETCWRFNFPDSPLLRDLTVFVDPNPILFSIEPVLIPVYSSDDSDNEEGDSGTANMVARRCLVPQLRTLTLAQFNRSCPIRRVSSLSETLHVDMTLEFGIPKPVPVHLSDVDNFIQMHLSGAVLPLEQLILRDVIVDADDGTPAICECAVRVMVESTAGRPPAAKVPFTFCHDLEVAWMYCIRG